HELYETDANGTKTLTAVPTVLGICLNSVGIHEITPKNVDEAFLRLEMLADVDGGGPFVKNGTNHRLTLDHVERCIGLSVNTAEQTRRDFERNLTVWLREKAQRALARQRQRQAIEARGYLFDFTLKVALDTILQARAAGADRDAVTLGDAQRELLNWGPDDWLKALKLHTGHHYTLGTVADANIQMRRLTDAFSLDTPLLSLYQRNNELKGKAKP